MSYKTLTSFVTPAASLNVRPKSRIRVPCTLMRGGTSRGPFFIASDLPSDPVARNKLLLQIMGRPEFRRVDGIGGMDPITSKLAIISKSERSDADVDYLFGQAQIDTSRLDLSANCGNLLSAVAPYALEEKLVPASDPVTLVRIHNVNTGVIVHAFVQTPNGEVEYEGDCQIDGVPGTGAPVNLQFLDSIGAITGKLFPTGQRNEIVYGARVSCLDVSVPLVIVDATSVGKTGYETPLELNEDSNFLDRFERIRQACAIKMGMGDCSASVLPKICLVAAPRGGGSLSSRYFSPNVCHPSHAVTGALCLGVAFGIPGTIANEFAQQDPTLPAFHLEHPTGKLSATIKICWKDQQIVIEEASFIRTASRLFEGFAWVPQTIH